MNFNKHPLLIGGLSSADPVLERPGQVHSDDLVGCVHSVSVNGRALNLSSPVKTYGVQATCNRNNNGGPCSQGHPDDPALSLCGPFGECKDRWHTAMCCKINYKNMVLRKGRSIKIFQFVQPNYIKCLFCMKLLFFM